MRRFLLAVDDSDASARSVRVARELARSAGCEVLIVHVRDKELCCKGPAWEKPMLCAPENLVAGLVRELREAGVQARGEIHSSLNHREAEEILATAGDFDADLIVAGWRPRRTLGGILQKSTGQKIAEQSPIPLLLVP
jgi:nucleotide-binding universal stress UspA family protein